MQLRKVLEKISRITGDNLSVQRVQTALTNKIYKITSIYQEKTWALRVSNNKYPELGIDRTREARVLRLIKSQPWSVYPDFIEQDICLTEWIQGRHFYLHSADQLTGLADLVTSIHGQTLDTLSNTEPMNINKRLTQLADQTTMKPNTEFNRLLSEKINHYEPPEALTLCHFDIHPGNLILSDVGLKLLDWEYAAAGDPLVDIACTAEGFKLNSSEKKHFYQALNVSEQAMLLPTCLTQALSLLWYMNRFPETDYSCEQALWVKTWKE